MTDVDVNLGGDVPLRFELSRASLEAPPSETDHDVLRRAKAIAAAADSRGVGFRAASGAAHRVDLWTAGGEVLVHGYATDDTTATVASIAHGLAGTMMLAALLTPAPVGAPSGDFSRASLPAVADALREVGKGALGDAVRISWVVIESGGVAAGCVVLTDGRRTAWADLSDGVDTSWVEGDLAGLATTVARTVASAPGA